MSGRVLVSNRGEGNWPTSAAAGENNLNSGTDIYFPRGTGALAPTDAQCFGADFDHLGWGSKTNWMVQLDITGTIEVNVYAMRPSNVEELVISVASADTTQGGIGGEEIYGPVKSFRFERATGAGSALCYVTAWNYGDINS
jgi:hypothetical protein